MKRGVTLGANCTIICGAVIGEYAFVGAESLINRDSKPYALMVGVPARQIGWISKYGERLLPPLTRETQFDLTYETVGGERHNRFVLLSRHGSQITAIWEPWE